MIQLRRHFLLARILLRGAGEVLIARLDFLDPSAGLDQGMMRAGMLICGSERNEGAGLDLKPVIIFAILNKSVQPSMIFFLLHSNVRFSTYPS